MRQPTDIDAPDALELALDGIQGAPIGVIAEGTRPVLTWLQRAGHDARALGRAELARRHRPLSNDPRTCAIFALEDGRRR